MVNWEKLKNPDGPFTPFVPKSQNDIEFWRKVVIFERKLLTKRMFLVDDQRTPQIVHGIVKRCLYGSNDICNLIYEIGDFGGIIGFLNITEGGNAQVIVKPWSKDIAKLSVMKGLKRLISTVMEEFDLRRLTSDTASKQIKALAERAGMVVEGTLVQEYKWGGQYYDRYLLAKYGRGIKHV